MITKLLTSLFNKFQPLKALMRQLVFWLTLSLAFTSNVQAQCGPYQYYESIGTGLGTLGWLTYGGSWGYPTSATIARSGNNYIAQTNTNATAIPIYLKSQKINTPQTFSFYVKSSVAAVTYGISFSDDNGATWTNIPNGATTLSTTFHPAPFAVTTASLPASLTTWQLATVTAAFPACVNGYYFRISDTRPNSTAGTLFLDDFSGKSSVASENTIVVPAINPVAATPSVCNVTVPAGSVYHFYDVGGLNELYSNGQLNNVIFTPGTAGDKIKITVVAANLAMATTADLLNIYDSTTIGTNVIAGSPVSATPLAAPYVSSLSTDGSMAIQFKSNGTYAVTAASSMADGFDIIVECSSSICPLPTSTPVVSAITSTTAALTWTGISGGYEYTATNSATAPTGSGTYTTATSATMTGLTPNTFYYAWVRSKCGPTFYSAWVKSAGFMTQCSPNTVPYTENFNGLSYALPYCTSADPSGDWQTLLVSGNLVGTTTTNFFYTKPITLSAATKYNLSYDYYTAGGTANFDVYIGSLNDPAILIPANKLFSHVGVSALTNKSLTFTSGAAGVYYIGYYLASTSAEPTTQLFLDNIILDCVSPVITASTTSVCSTNDIVSLTGSGTTGYTWSSSSGNLYSDAAATIPYTPLANLTTVYFRTNANATITVTGINGGCTKTATLNINVRSTKWNGANWDNGTPDATTQAIFNGNYASNNLVTPGDINACSVIVQSGTVLFKAGHSLIVQNSLTVSGGSLTFENNASLVQPNNIANAGGVYSGGNSGAITYQRTTKPMTKYDYTYWSSPVGANTLLALSPLTLSDKYYYFDAASSNYWAPIANTTTMTPGTGYIIRAPQTFDTSYQNFATSFSGVPNNGTITTPIVAGRFNLIGNPYPSALDIDKFMSNALNNMVVDATIYLWTHNTPIAANIYEPNDYAVYNYLGGLGTKPAPSGSTGGLNNDLPNGKIASGQSFFIRGLATSTNATFLNTMRVVGTNSQFFKMPSNNNPIPKKASRIWLDVSSPQGAYKQTLIGYSNKATLGIDRGYDGEFFNFGSSLSLYSLSGTTALAIQGRPLPFDESDEVPLGFNTITSGTFTISLYNFDGLFSNKKIILKDLLLNTNTNLKQSNYSFASETGTFNDRFVLVYEENEKINEQESSGFNQSKITLYKPNNELIIDAGTTIIKKVRVHDIKGLLLFEKQGINATQTALNLQKLNQVLLVEITTQNDEVITRKYLD